MNSKKRLRYSFKPPFVSEGTGRSILRKEASLTQSTKCKVDGGSDANVRQRERRALITMKAAEPRSTAQRSGGGDGL